MNVEACIQSILHKKTIEIIYFNRRRGLELGSNAEEGWEKASIVVIQRAEMSEKPTLSSKKRNNEGNGGKQVNKELILNAVIKGEKSTININKASDIEEEDEVAKSRRKKYKEGIRN